VQHQRLGVVVNHRRKQMLLRGQQNLGFRHRHSSMMTEMENRRDFFAAFGVAMLAAGANPAQAKVTDGLLGSHEAQSIEHPFGVQQIYHQGPTDMLEYLESGNLRLLPGLEPHPPHKHPEEEI